MSDNYQSILCEVNVYPVKSIGGIALSSAWVEKQGLSFDRRFMLAFDNGSMATARKYPQMVLVQASLVADGIVITYPERTPLRLRYSEFTLQEVETQVWNDKFMAYSTTKQACQWFSDLLGDDVQLLFSGEQSNRVKEELLGQNVSFADGSPVLVISQASLDELNRRSSEHHEMTQFRTNLVVSGDEPFIEDGWKRIRIGEVEFETVKPCERCILATLDPSKAQFKSNMEPLKTLSKFRTNERGGVNFGQKLKPINEGMIRVGDVIEVLEMKPKEEYAENSSQELQLTCVEREWIAPDFATFWFKPLSGQLPNYKAGQHLPIDVEINGKKVSRYYTLSSSPTNTERYAISVKRVEGGKVSNWLLDNLQIGDNLNAYKPSGDFQLNETDFPLLLLSAGSGITPMLSFLRYMADSEKLKDVVFLYQCRNEEDIPYRHELDKLNQLYPQLNLMISWDGLSGPFSMSHLEQVPDLTKRQVFVCGPEGFMQKANNLLLEMGLPESQYHQEAFGIASQTVVEKQELSITINGAQFIGDNQRSLLVQVEDAGFEIASSCRAGLCGLCKVSVTSGDYSQPDVPALLAEDREANQVLACCCVPRGDISIES